MKKSHSRSTIKSDAQVAERSIANIERFWYTTQMPKRWTKAEEKQYREKLFELYVKQNKALKEIALELGIAEQTVFQRLCRLNIKTRPHQKENYLGKRTDVVIPNNYSNSLAEFFGIMLGDGHLTHFQIVVNLGNKEKKYAEYVSSLISGIFCSRAKIAVRRRGYRDVYLGSVAITEWLFKQGLVLNKVRSQVAAPKWIFGNRDLIQSFLRGFFDTDGSVYKLRYGIQISFSNRSHPLLQSLQKMLYILEYSPSMISSDKLYLTRLEDIQRFFREIKPENPKHRRRFKNFMRRSDSGYSSGL